jgi:intracellular sulfur oxidation DsrE/DsrF family protein
MKAIWQSIMILVLGFSGLYSAEQEVVKKVVYNLTTGDINQLERRLIKGIIAHTTYYQGKLEELDVRVVVHGDAYKFFMKDLNHTAYAYEPSLVEKKASLGKRLASLSKQYAVKFMVCEAGVIAKKLPKKAFYPFVSMVHNAAIGLIDAQNEGYAYLEVE